MQAKEDGELLLVAVNIQERLDLLRDGNKRLDTLVNRLERGAVLDLVLVGLAIENKPRSPVRPLLRNVNPRRQMVPAPVQAQLSTLQEPLPRAFI